MILPEFRGHRRRRENAPGGVHGQTAATTVSPRRFKQEAVRLCLRHDRSIGQVARELDLTESALRRWVQQYEVDHGPNPSGALTTEEKTELRTLRREVRVLREEREILKKAAAFFAKEKRMRFAFVSRGEGPPRRAALVQRATGDAQRLLRLGASGPERATTGQRPVEGTHPGDPYRQPRNVRQPADPRAAQAGRGPSWPGAGRPTAAGHGADRPAPQAAPVHDGQ